MGYYMQSQKITKLSLLLSLPAILLGCGGADKGSFSNQQICVAAIASTMSQDPSIININSFKGDITHLSYIRPDDGKKWAYRCKLNGNKVIWASDTGRWRNGQYDSVITFSVNGNKVNISEKYDDGSGGTKEFTSEELKS
jgi:hypothetical protein